jgi:hypothetical protein
MTTRRCSPEMGSHTAIFFLRQHVIEEDTTVAAIEDTAVAVAVASKVEALRGMRSGGPSMGANSVPWLVRTKAPRRGNFW